MWESFQSINLSVPTTVGQHCIEARVDPIKRTDEAFADTALRAWRSGGRVRVAGALPRSRDGAGRCGAVGRFCAPIPAIESVPWPRQTGGSRVERPDWVRLACL